MPALEFGGAEARLRSRCCDWRGNHTEAVRTGFPRHNATCEGSMEALRPGFPCDVVTHEGKVEARGIGFPRVVVTGDGSAEALRAIVMCFSSICDYTLFMPYMISCNSMHPLDSTDRKF